MFANAAKLLFCSESWSGDFDKNQYYFIAQRSDYCFAQPLDQQSIIFLNTFIFHVPSRYAIDHIKNVLCSCALPVTHCYSLGRRGSAAHRRVGRRRAPRRPHHDVDDVRAFELACEPAHAPPHAQSPCFSGNTVTPDPLWPLSCQTPFCQAPFSISSFSSSSPGLNGGSVAFVIRWSDPEGLRNDDLYDPYFDLDIKKVLGRLPREVVRLDAGAIHHARSLVENKPKVHPKSTGMKMNRYLYLC